MRINTELAWQQYNNTLASSNVKKIKEKADDQNNDLMVVANEFTSILMKQMFKAMRNTVPKSDFINAGFAEEVFTDMLDGEVSKKGAEQVGFNSLSRLLYQQLKR